MEEIICPICKKKITANMGWCLRNVEGNIHKVHQACYEAHEPAPEIPTKDRE